MKNITLSIDEELLTQSREVAAWKGTSLNGLIRNILKKMTSTPHQQDWFEGYALVSAQISGDSGGWKFNRDELYDDRL